MVGVFTFPKYLTRLNKVCIVVSMKKVIIPRGIPGSGKTTWVKQQLALHPAGTAVRISNDDLSHMLYGQEWGTFFFSDVAKETLHKLRLSMLKTFLNQDGITHIYVDNTNIAVQTVKSLQEVALRAGAEFIVDDQFLSVPVGDCIARDAQREKPVGAGVILKMAKPLEKLKPWTVPSIPVIEKYDNDPMLKDVIIVDIDGTVALMVDRGPYEFHKVDSDVRNDAVADLLDTLVVEGIAPEIVFLSGRGEECRAETTKWLSENFSWFEWKETKLYMRPAGDSRPDWIVKYELFQEHLAGKYHVQFVLDDRDQVVDLWRNKLGLPTFQVAEGNF